MHTPVLDSKTSKTAALKALRGCDNAYLLSVCRALGHCVHVQMESTRSCQSSGNTRNGRVLEVLGGVLEICHLMGRSSWSQNIVQDPLQLRAVN